MFVAIFAEFFSDEVNIHLMISELTIFAQEIRHYYESTVSTRSRENNEHRERRNKENDEIWRTMKYGERRIRKNDDEPLDSLSKDDSCVRLFHLDDSGTLSYGERTMHWNQLGWEISEFHSSILPTEEEENAGVGYLAVVVVCTLLEWASIAVRLGKWNLGVGFV
ncbi:hypothetical protein H5410_022896 [Solanum commersonii]|uniref:Uncharacterized protein n=1 Tax=Solanum commersonii TaxID=4109 RepID=A0A9J5ZI16_SOLCO|nr:hypothetical protein H5410_022896 [Solanum commersonii]